MNTGYEFKDRELENFYKFSTRRPEEQRHSRGGVYFYKNIHRKDILSGEEKLHIVEYYRVRFCETGHDKESLTLKHVLDGSRLEIIRSRGKLFMPSYELGKEIITKRLNRELRSLVNAFESIVNGSPDELARAMFGEF